MLYDFNSLTETFKVTKPSSRMPQITIKRGVNDYNKRHLVAKVLMIQVLYALQVRKTGDEVAKLIEHSVVKAMAAGEAHYTTLTKQAVRGNIARVKELIKTWAKA